MKFWENLKIGRYKDFLFVILFTGFIYLTIPIARYISNFLLAHKLLKLSVYLLVSIFILSSIYLIFTYISFRLLNIVILTVFFVIYIMIVQTYDILVEKIHFIEYGILAYLLYRALKPKLHGSLIYPASFIILTLIGWGDELIQYFLPDRYYDFRDVVLNGLSGGLILILIYTVEKLKKDTFKSISA